MRKAVSGVYTTFWCMCLLKTSIYKAQHPTGERLSSSQHVDTSIRSLLAGPPGPWNPGIQHVRCLRFPDLPGSVGLIAYSVFGINCLQFYLYYTRYSQRDTPVLKGYVGTYFDIQKRG